LVTTKENRFVVRAKSKRIRNSGDFGKSRGLLKVGTSEELKLIEPRLSDQWFLKMEDLVKRIKAVLEDGEVKLHPF
jgi:valyl-tRNA synthetase